MVLFSETWLNWVDGITTTDSELDVIIRVDDASTKDDVFLGEDDVRISDDENGADDDNNITIDDVFTPGDDCAKQNNNNNDDDDDDDDDDDNNNKEINNHFQYINSMFFSLSIMLKYKLKGQKNFNHFFLPAFGYVVAVTLSIVWSRLANIRDCGVQRGKDLECTY